MNRRVNCFAFYCPGLLCLLLNMACIVLPTSAYAIEIEDRYGKYDGQKVLLTGGWNHGHNPFIDHHTMDANGGEGGQ